MLIIDTMSHLLNENLGAWIGGSGTHHKGNRALFRGCKLILGPSEEMN